MNIQSVNPPYKRRQAVMLLASIGSIAAFFLSDAHASSKPHQWTEVGGNGHWYQAVTECKGITWHGARAAAEAAGVHLAAIASAEENAFVYDLVANDAMFWSGPNIWGSLFGPWLGGYLDSAGWHWVTQEPFSQYTNWGSTEPNGQNALHFYRHPGVSEGDKWADLQADPIASGQGVAVKGYIVESSSAFEPLQDSCDVVRPIINIKPGSNPNSINTCARGTIPVLIFGSKQLDVVTIDTAQLVLASAQVKTAGKTKNTLCGIDDRGSHDPSQFDSLGAPDGYPDLTCHFDMKAIVLTDAATTADLEIAGCLGASDAGGCLPESPGFYTGVGTDAVRIVRSCSNATQ